MTTYSALSTPTRISPPMNSLADRSITGTPSTSLALTMRYMTARSTTAPRGHWGSSKPSPRGLDRRTTPGAGRTSRSGRATIRYNTIKAITAGSNAPISAAYAFWSITSPVTRSSARSTRRSRTPVISRRTGDCSTSASMKCRTTSMPSTADPAKAGSGLWITQRMPGQSSKTASWP